MIKKITALLLILFTMFSISACNVKKRTRTQRTNIIACINNYPIDSYMIEDKLYVEAENLSNYGFDVKKNGNNYEIKIGEKEMKPKHNVKYYSEKELKKKGLIYTTSSSVAVLFENIKVKGYDLDGKFLIPIDAFKERASGFEYKKDVKNLIFSKLKGFGNSQEYRYIKLKGKGFFIEDFLTFTFDDIKNALGKEYKEEKKGEYTVISYDKDICPVKMYFKFGDDKEKNGEAKLKKLFVDSKGVKLEDTDVLGMTISDFEKIVKKDINVHLDEKEAILHNGKKYSVVFKIDEEEKILSYELTDK
jgi:hypothetical protein